MSSTTKALELLSFFSTTRPEMGLSQLCRLAGRNKTTTYRNLQALKKNGFIEQDPTSRHYRLGPVVMQLAQVREATVPRKKTALNSIRRLAGVTGETAHVTVLSGNTLYGLCECESPLYGIRAVIDINTFPLHATASGLCALAFGPTELFDIAIQELPRYTSTTPRTKEELSNTVSEVAQTGFGRAKKTFEDEIEGIAVPVFDQTGQYAGSVAIACVASRFDCNSEHTIKTELVLAAHEISRNWGGRIPSHIEATWTQSLSTSDILEPQ